MARHVLSPTLSDCCVSPLAPSRIMEKPKKEPCVPCVVGGIAVRSRVNWRIIAVKISARVYQLAGVKRGGPKKAATDVLRRQQRAGRAETLTGMRAAQLRHGNAITWRKTAQHNARWAVFSYQLFLLGLLALATLPFVSYRSPACLYIRYLLYTHAAAALRCAASLLRVSMARQHRRWTGRGVRRHQRRQTDVSFRRLLN